MCIKNNNSKINYLEWTEENLIDAIRKYHLNIEFIKQIFRFNLNCNKRILTIDTVYNYFKLIFKILFRNCEKGGMILVNINFKVVLWS